MTHSEFYDAVGRALESVRPLFGNDYKFTFIARNTKNDKGHCVVSADGEDAPALVRRTLDDLDRTVAENHVGAVTVLRGGGPDGEG